VASKGGISHSEENDRLLKEETAPKKKHRGQEKGLFEGEVKSLFGFCSEGEYVPEKDKNICKQVTLGSFGKDKPRGRCKENLEGGQT